MNTVVVGTVGAGVVVGRSMHVPSTRSNPSVHSGGSVVSGTVVTVVVSGGTVVVVVVVLVVVVVVVQVDSPNDARPVRVPVAPFDHTADTVTLVDVADPGAVVVNTIGCESGTGAVTTGAVRFHVYPRTASASAVHVISHVPSFWQATSDDTTTG